MPLLVAAGHEVAGTTRSDARVEMLRGLGAEPVVVDVYDRERLCEAVVAFGPELIAAAQAAEAPRFFAQSIAWRLPGDAHASVDEHERMVLNASGVVARYGRFHGPGTYHERDLPEPPYIHVAEAARRTVELLEAPSGVVKIVES